MTQYLTSIIACPLCKDIIKSFSRLSEGYFWSIVLMLTIPFLLVGFFGGFLARAYLLSTLSACPPQAGRQASTGRKEYSAPQKHGEGNK